MGWQSHIGNLQRREVWTPHFKAYDFFSFVGGNPTLEIYKKERPHFPYKRGPLSLDLEGEGKRETIGLLHKKKVRDPNSP